MLPSWDRMLIFSKVFSYNFPNCDMFKVSLNLLFKRATECFRPEATSLVMFIILQILPYI